VGKKTTGGLFRAPPLEAFWVSMVATGAEFVETLRPILIWRTASYLREFWESRVRARILLFFGTSLNIHNITVMLMFFRES
jgi:hypothetical protein